MTTSFEGGAGEASAMDDPTQLKGKIREASWRRKLAGGSTLAQDLKGESAKQLASAQARRSNSTHPAVVGLGDKDDEDDLKVEYCAAMSSVYPDQLLLSYAVCHECRFLHSKTPPDPATFNKLTSGGSKRTKQQDAWSKYSTVREYLAKEHPIDSLLGNRKKSYTQKELVTKIMESGYNSIPGNEFSGFACITGGQEMAQDLEKGLWGVRTSPVKQ